MEGAWPLDITDPAAVEHAVMFVKPDWIFCPAALSHVDYCEDHADEAFAINRDAPLHLARMGQRLGAGFLLYSTDYVFDGVGGPFAEDDPRAPPGRVRPEQARGASAPCWAWCPARWCCAPACVYGPERQQKNFAYQLIRACRAGSPSARRSTSARAPPTTPTWPRPAWSWPSATCAASTTWPGSAVLDR